MPESYRRSRRAKHRKNGSAGFGASSRPWLATGYLANAWRALRSAPRAAALTATAMVVGLVAAWTLAPLASPEPPTPDAERSPSPGRPSSTSKLASPKAPGGFVRFTSMTPLAPQRRDRSTAPEPSPTASSSAPSTSSAAPTRTSKPGGGPRTTKPGQTGKPQKPSPRPK